MKKMILVALVLALMIPLVACATGQTTTTASTTQSTTTSENPTVLPKFAKEYPFVATVAPELQGKVEARYKFYFNSDGRFKIDVLLKNSGKSLIAGGELELQLVIERISDAVEIFSIRDGIPPVEPDKTIVFGPGFNLTEKNVDNLRIKIIIAKYN